ncbi:MAG: Lpg1974 family pore-forming outer membrane protein [Chlamydiae bacterium]|nr:Lpg1974 family pore-forming outer membrane protein [Chlamydiota bacterium]
MHAKNILYPLSLALMSSLLCSFTSLDLASAPIEDNTHKTEDSSSISTPKPGSCEGFILSVDGLLWTASESGLSYATTASSNPELGKGHIKNPNFRWQGGFRVGAGFHIPHGSWDTLMNYTWFHDTAKGKTENNPENYLIATGISAINNTHFRPYAISCDAKWKLFLDILDLQLGRTMIPAKWISFRPFIGTKAAWIHQKYEINYSDLVSNYQSLDYEVDLKNNYWGIGPMVGLNTQFWMGYGFSIFGNIAASLVYGQFTLKQQETADNDTVADLSNNYYAGRAITDLQLGLRWDSNVCKSKKASVCQCEKIRKKTNFSMTAGWEQHLFFSQGEFMHFTDATNAGRFTQEHNDLSVQGATLSMRLDF